MIKETIERFLTELNILPFPNSLWKSFDICLRFNSSKQQYIEVKRAIREKVVKKTGGLYIIARSKKILYIGESEESIQRRLIRHIDKMFTRTDSRSDFFKLEQHQGLLSIYYLPLPPELIEMRRAFEDLLTNVLEPEYKKWIKEEEQQ